MSSDTGFKDSLRYLYFTVVFPWDATFYISEGNIVLSTPLHLFESFSYFSVKKVAD